MIGKSKLKSKTLLYNLRVKKNRYRKVFFILLFTILVGTFLIQKNFYFLHWVKDDSLESNFNQGDLLLFEEFDLYARESIKTGDLVAFEVHPQSYTFLEGVGDAFLYVITLGSYSHRPSQLVVRRVVGLASENIMIRNKSIYRNSKLFIPDWSIKFEDVRIIPGEVSSRDNLGETFIPNDHVFVLSDHWDSLSDSRVFKAIPYSRIKGVYKRTIY